MILKHVNTYYLQFMYIYIFKYSISCCEKCPNKFEDICWYGAFFDILHAP
jgi:hypothetical protein